MHVIGAEASNPIKTEVIVTTTLISLLVAVSSTLFIWLMRRKSPSPINLNSFVDGVKAAANEGERAYRAQVKEISRKSGQEMQPTTRGVAIARLLCALFPAAAYVSLDSNDLVVTSVKRYAPFSGKETWDLAIGAAFMPLDLAKQPYFTQVKEQAYGIIQSFVDFLNENFDPAGNPVDGIAAAERDLGSLWHEALELSVGKIEESQYNTQFCTSGLHLLAEWMTALDKRN